MSEHAAENDALREREAERLAAALGVEKHEGHLRVLWRDLADSRIEHGVDWPGIVRTLFRDLDGLITKQEARVTPPGRGA